MTILRQLPEIDLAKANISLYVQDEEILIEIETSRLYIRSYQDEDFENCVALYSNSKNTKYFDNGKPRSRAEILRLIIQKANRYFKKGKPLGLFSIFLKENMTFIGQIDLLLTSKPGLLEIGYIIDPKYQNKGYCTEAVKAVLFDYVNELNDRGFTTRGIPIHSVMATVHPDNHPSRRIIEKFGMDFKKFQNRFGSPRLWYLYQCPQLQNNIAKHGIS